MFATTGKKFITYATAILFAAFLTAIAFAGPAFAGEQDIASSDASALTLSTTDASSAPLPSEDATAAAEANQDIEASAASDSAEDDSAITISSSNESVSANTAASAVRSGFGWRDIESPFIHSEDEGFGTMAALPSSYSSLSISPTVRNQGYYGSCWSFSAIGMIEYSLISHGLTGTNVDLAERQLLYFFYNKLGIADPLGNLAGDYNTNLEDDYLNIGGNTAFTMWALASWMGAADESSAKYSNLTASAIVKMYLNDYAQFRSITDLDSSLAYGANVAHVQNIDVLPMSDTVGIKTAIMENGAVGFAYYHSSEFYNSETNFYYNYLYEETNHAALIIGWDDDKEAWLVRNSWGDNNFSENGYLWLSYNDLSINGSGANAFVVYAESADNYDNNYQYDGSAGPGYLQLAKNSQIANVFTAGAPGADAETLKAVGFGTMSANVSYSIQVYTNLTNLNNPTSGTPQLSSPVTGTVRYAGYHTIDLGQDIELAEGETFAIVITNAGSSSAAFAVENSIDYGWISFTADNAAQQSFAKKSGVWYDLSTQGSTFGASGGACARIKAYTDSYSLTDISEATADEIGTQAFTGSAVEPTVLLSYQGANLVEGTDFTVEYTNNTQPGVAKAIITGIGDFKGSTTVHFSIVSSTQGEPEVIGLSLTTGGETGINWYVDMGFITSENEDEYCVTFTKDGQTSTQPVELEAGTSICKFTYEVSAKEMTTPVTFIVQTTDGYTLSSSTRCAVDYYRNILSMTDSQLTEYAGSYAAGQALKEFSRAALEFGGCAQTYFGFDTDHLASEGVTSAISGTTIDASNKVQMTKGSGLGIKSYSVTLVLESNTSVRLYVTLDGTVSINDLNATVDGTKATFHVAETDTSSNPTHYYIEKTNISASDLAVPVNFAISRTGAGTTTVSYSPMSYAYSKQSCGDASLEALSKALYNYNQAALAYFD